MAKITIVGDAAVVTSGVKLEDLKTVEKYRPDALTLYGGEDGKEPVFRVVTSESGHGEINRYGASFASATYDDDKLATITCAVNIGEGSNAREVVADALGSALVSLNKIEAGLPGVLEEIAADRAAVLDSITVIQ